MRILLAAVAALAFTFTASAADLPDLEGRKIVVVTENAYPPLQFKDPKHGRCDRLGV